MSLFENMQTNFLDKDLVTYMNGVRAAGFCRPWSSSLKILKECSSHLGGENILPVVNTIITNLKYHDRFSIESSTSVVKAQEILFWILTQGLQPSSQTMVITFFSLISYEFSEKLSQNIFLSSPYIENLIELNALLLFNLYAI